MDTATLGDVSIGKGFYEKAPEYYKQALELEKMAAFMTSASDDDPIPHFILLRSAAALALRAKLFEESERLIEICLAENPPAFIRKDLADIAELIRQDRNGELKQPETPLEIEGILTNILAEENQITVKSPTLSQSFLLVVPKDRMHEIVKKHWSKKVNVVARQTPHGVMVLEKISAAA